MRNYGIPKDNFCYRIGYGLNADEMNELLSNRAPSKVNCIRRAFFSNNQEIEGWFRTFEDKEDE